MGTLFLIIGAIILGILVLLFMNGAAAGIAVAAMVVGLAVMLFEGEMGWLIMKGGLCLVLILIAVSIVRLFKGDD